MSRSLVKLIATVMLPFTLNSVDGNTQGVFSTPTPDFNIYMQLGRDGGLDNFPKGNYTLIIFNKDGALVFTMDNEGVIDYHGHTSKEAAEAIQDSVMSMTGSSR